MELEERLIYKTKFVNTYGSRDRSVLSLALKCTQYCSFENSYYLRKGEMLTSIFEIIDRVTKK